MGGIMDGGGWRRIWERARAVARGLWRRSRPAAEVPVPAPPPPRRLLPPEPIPADPAEHARQFATTWADRFEAYARRRMREVGVPEDWIGTPDVDNRIEKRAFFPHESVGGDNIHRRGINLDSGILNPDLIDARKEPALSSPWRRARLRHRADAVIAHEYEEAAGATPLDHEGAKRAAPETRLAIAEPARHLLRVAAGRHR